MEQTGHPLHIIQQYQIEREQAENLLRIMSRLGRRSLAAITGLSRRRLDTLPFAALLLERLLRRARPKAIVFSAFGLREGYVFSRLPATLRRQDPLLAAARDQADRDGRFGAMGVALEKWTRPLFADKDSLDLRLRHAVCLLSDIAWRDHPDYRAEQAFTRILRLPIGGIEHGERVFAAAAVAARYAGSLEPVAGEGVLRLIDEPSVGRALVLGLALRLAYSLSGATPGLLEETSLRVTPDRLNLHLPKEGAVMYGEAVSRRLEALGRALGLPVGIVNANARAAKSAGLSG